MVSPETWQWRWQFCGEGIPEIDCGDTVQRVLGLAARVRPLSVVETMIIPLVPSARGFSEARMRELGSWMTEVSC